MALKLVSSFPARFSEALGDSSNSLFALSLGLSKQTISAYKNGTRKPKSPTIKAIAKELNVSETWLLGYDVPKNDVSDLVRSSPEDYNFDEIQRLMRADPDSLDEVQRQAVEINQKLSKRHKFSIMDLLNPPVMDDENILLSNYRTLNDEGKEFIRKTMEMVLGNPDYTKKSENSGNESEE